MVKKKEFSIIYYWHSIEKRFAKNYIIITKLLVVKIKEIGKLLIIIKEEMIYKPHINRYKFHLYIFKFFDINNYLLRVAFSQNSYYLML